MGMLKIMKEKFGEKSVGQPDSLLLDWLFSSSLCHLYLFLGGLSARSPIWHEQLYILGVLHLKLSLHV